MASITDISKFHIPLSAIMLSGSILNVAGLSLFFTATEYKDMRQHVNRHSVRNLSMSQQSKWKWMIIFSYVLYICSIILFVIGLSLYKNEKVELSGSNNDIYLLNKKTSEQPSVNIPAIIASLSGVLILIGCYFNIHTFNRSLTWNWKGMVPFILGWTGFAITAAMSRKTISNIQSNRLAWSLPSIAVYLAAILFVPMQLQKNYMQVPLQMLMMIGLLGFSISNSYIHSVKDD